MNFWAVSQVRVGLLVQQMLSSPLPRYSHFLKKPYIPFSPRSIFLSQSAALPLSLLATLRRSFLSSSPSLSLSLGHSLSNLYLSVTVSLSLFLAPFRLLPCTALDQLLSLFVVPICHRGPFFNLLNFQIRQRLSFDFFLSFKLLFFLVVCIRFAGMMQCCLSYL